MARKGRKEEHPPKTLGRAYLIEKLGKHGLSRRRSLRVLNFMFREIKRALVRGEEVEFAGGRLLRVDPAKLSRGPYDEENWPARWPRWKVIWVPHWETLVRLVGLEEAEKKLLSDSLSFDDVVMEEYMAWRRAERKRAAASREQSRRKSGKGQKERQLTGK